jgi:uncharacterized membrane protein YdjX (TVP38/TMEM64 family)
VDDARDVDRRLASLERMPLRRFAALAPVVLSVVAASLVLPHSPAGLRELVAATGGAAPIAALAAWLLLTPALFPGTLLAAAGGLAFGAVGGAALAWGGAVLGGLAAFALARTVARDPALRLARRSRRLGQTYAALERRGFATVLAARLMPGVPATALHYVAGASPVGWPAFAGAIAVGALLRTAPYAVVGEGLASGSGAGIALAAASIAIGGGVSVVLLRRAGDAPSHR